MRIRDKMTVKKTCRVDGAVLKPAGYPTFGLLCFQCGRLHNRDGSLMEATGSPVETGMSSEEARRLVDEIWGSQDA